jgi:hypothetical protein
MKKCERIVQLLPGSINGGITTNGEVIFQRQGVGTVLRAGIVGHNGFGFSVEAGKESKQKIYLFNRDSIEEQRYDIESIDDTIIHIKDLVDVYGGHTPPQRVSKQIWAYMFSGSILYEYQRDDIILSPIRYDAYSDTIRHVPTNYCLVAFREGKFNNPILDMDKAAADYRQFIEKALNKGFRNFVYENGNDYCKRRLAWLAGVYLYKHQSNAGQVTSMGILSQSMEWPERYVAL